MPVVIFIGIDFYLLLPNPIGIYLRIKVIVISFTKLHRQSILVFHNLYDLSIIFNYFNYINCLMTICQEKN